MRHLTNLRQLYLSGLGITDVGLEHLQSLTQLTHLHLFDTGVTPTGEPALRSELPMLAISH